MSLFVLYLYSVTRFLFFWPKTQRYSFLQKKRFNILNISISFWYIFNLHIYPKCCHLVFTNGWYMVVADFPSVFLSVSLSVVVLFILVSQLLVFL